MDNELEQQIDELIQKTAKDLKVKICRIVSKQQTKIVKDHARQLKSRKVPTSSDQRSDQRSSKRRDTDDDSD